jgi:hypothetical protein
MSLCECGCEKDAGVYKNYGKGMIKGQSKHFIKGHRSRPRKTRCIRGHDLTLPNSQKGHTCRLCIREQKHTPEGKERARIWASSPKGHAGARKSRLKSKGWTPEMFKQTLLEQGNVCALCRKPFTEGDPAHADHKHVNPPEPRGVLHRNCNLAIGLFRDNPEMCREAAAYLESWSDT